MNRNGLERTLHGRDEAHQCKIQILLRQADRSDPDSEELLQTLLELDTRIHQRAKKRVWLRMDQGKAHTCRLGRSLAFSTLSKKLLFDMSLSREKYFFDRLSYCSHLLDSFYHVPISS